MAKRRDFRWGWIGILTASALLGGAAAVGVAGLLVFSTATGQLRDYALEFLSYDEKIATNIDETLAQANGSGSPACSDADLGVLRTLLFQSPYLKDVGRVKGDALVCSAVAGRMAKPVASEVGASMTYKTRKIYYNVDLQMAKGHHAEVVAEERSNVVVSPDAFADFSRLPMLFAGAIVSGQPKKALQMYTSSPNPMPLELMLSGETVVRDGMLYLPMCSAKRPDCVLTALPVAVIWERNRGLMAGAFAVGAALGLCLALIGALAQRRKRSLANQLRRALKRKKLWVVYQPVVNVRTNAIVGCEALVRWRDENLRIVRPDVFVSVAEEEGFISDLTLFVLERVLTEVGEVLREREGFRVSVNLSAKDLVEESFLPRLDALLERYEVPARQVGLELTERSTVDKVVTIEGIRRLRDRGHVVYIDDFGTGYSSLAYLHELQVDVLKIDRVFTNTIGTESITASIVPQILGMAEALKLQVVVEGVEHRAQAEYLMRAGGEIAAQGWLFGEPVTAEALQMWLVEEESLVEAVG